MDPSSILIKNARLRNLKGLTLRLPKNRLIALTGLSGSGKTTLAMDTLFVEGQRQFMESLGMLTFGLAKPAVDAIEGLMPAISLGQPVASHSPRSTVGTLTEVYTYLRVLYARLGRRPCPHCGAIVDVGRDSPDSLDGEEDSGEETPDASLPCPACGTPLPALSMASFSFNKPAGACPACAGLGFVQEPDLAQLLDESRSLRAGAVRGWNEAWTKYNLGILAQSARHYGLDLDPDRPLSAWSTEARDLLLYGAASEQILARFPSIQPPETPGKGRFEGLIPGLLRRQASHAADADYQQRLSAVLRPRVCPACAGTRLRAESCLVRVADKAIDELARLPLSDLAGWLADLPVVLGPDQQAIAANLLQDLQVRTGRLLKAGVGYLALERAAASLSAGESRRLRLAALLGSGLTGVLYVLDEPTVGLHPRDTGRLLEALRDLRDLGNTLLVIEHDLDLIRAADHVVELGPGAGRAGGRLVAEGTPAEVAADPASLTGGYLSGRLSVPASRRRPPAQQALVIHGARAHNLQNLTVRLPLGRLVALSGPSGSGKSSLLFDILERAALRHFGQAGEEPGEHDAVTGWEALQRLVSLDAAAMTRMPRSNVATFSDAFTPIREAFAALPAARAAGLESSHFSFNVPGGRCEHCQGAGVVPVEMHFLPDIAVRCPACQGRRFKQTVLEVRYGESSEAHGSDIAAVLEMTVEQALPVFQNVPPAARRLELLAEVGLGYLALGQPATTLSAGEAQRVRMARELGRKGAGRALFLLDEPTTGLHPADVARLMALLQRLVDAGHSVVVIEHNPDLLRAADWMIDLGPGGGPQGVRIMAEGAPWDLAHDPLSPTGSYL